MRLLSVRVGRRGLTTRHNSTPKPVVVVEIPSAAHVRTYSHIQKFGGYYARGAPLCASCRAGMRRRGEAALLRGALVGCSLAVAFSIGIPSPVTVSVSANRDALRSVVAIAGGRSAVSYGLTGGASGYGALWFDGETGGAYSSATPSNNNCASSEESREGRRGARCGWRANSHPPVQTAPNVTGLRGCRRVTSCLCAWLPTRWAGLSGRAGRC